MCKLGLSLSSILKSFWTIGLLVLLAPLSPAADTTFCAVNVKVSLADGLPINHTRIELVDASGEVVLREDVGPNFQICDFGFGPHTLRVGTNECLPVSISNLRVLKGRPLHLNVMLQPCFYGDVTRSDCLIYFRTIDSRHRAVPEVDFTPRLNSDQPTRTDSFGRWQGLFRGTIDVKFTKPGYEPVSVPIHCRRDEEVDKQVLLVKQGEGKTP